MPPVTLIASDPGRTASPTQQLRGAFFFASPLRISDAQKNDPASRRRGTHRQLRNYRDVHGAKSSRSASGRARQYLTASRRRLRTVARAVTPRSDGGLGRHAGQRRDHRAGSHASLPPPRPSADRSCLRSLQQIRRRPLVEKIAALLAAANNSASTDGFKFDTE